MTTWSKEETSLRENVRKAIKDALPEGSQVQVNRISAVTNPHTGKSGISVKCKIVLRFDRTLRLLSVLTFLVSR